MRCKVVIAGIGQTAQGKHLRARDHLVERRGVSQGAAGRLGYKDAVDALFVKYPTSEHRSMYGQTMAEAMGLQPRIGGVWDQGGAASASMIGFAAMAIEHGQCEVALVTIADNPRTGTRQAYERGWGDDAVFGWLGTPASYAMIARRHMQKLGTTQEQLGAVARACRRHGANNPDVQLRKPLTADDYAASRPVIEPLRRDDCCLISDGGAAVLLMSADRARQLGMPAPVPILGFGQGQTSWEVTQRPSLTDTAATLSAATAFEMAGQTAKDIQVAQIYDSFTITVLMSLYLTYPS